MLLKGDVAVAVPSVEEIFTVECSLPHDHAMAALGIASACGAPDWIDSTQAAMGIRLTKRFLNSPAERA